MVIGASWSLGSKQEIIKDIGIFIEDDYIKEVGKYDEIVKKYKGITSCKFYKNTLLIPSLYNTHHHLEYSFLKGLIEKQKYFEWIEELSKLKKIMTEEEKKQSAEYGIMLAISHGIGNIFEVSTDLNSVTPLVESGLGGELFIEFVGDEDYFSMKEKFKKYNEYAKNTNVNINIAAHTLYTCSKESIKSALRLAMEEDVYFSIHISETFQEYLSFKNKSCLLHDNYFMNQRTDLIKGYTPIQYFCNEFDDYSKSILVHSVYNDEKDMKLIKEKDLKVVSCPESNFILFNGISHLSKLISRFLCTKLSFGTDSLASCNTSDILYQVGLFILSQRVVNSDISLNSKYCLKMITENPAKMFEASDGIIKEGAKANIIGVEFDNFINLDKILDELIFSSEKRYILNIYNGKILYEYGNYYTVDKEKIKWNYDRFLKKIYGGQV